LVGAYLSDKNSTNPDAGAVYFFKRSGNIWSNQQKVIASNQAAFDHYGFSVSISGNAAIVGAYYAPFNGISQAGTAYIYTLSGNNWVEQQNIGASYSTQRKFFGWTVGISGDNAIVGAYNDFHDAQGKDFKGYAGAAYIFERNGNKWKEQKIVASDRFYDDYFGYSVAINGDYCIVGANQEDEDFQSKDLLADAGSAYIFKNPNGTYTNVKKLDHINVAPNPFHTSIMINIPNAQVIENAECFLLIIMAK
jgi:roadblock/LC7 domain-containing protein